MKLAGLQKLAGQCGRRARSRWARWRHTGRRWPSIGVGRDVGGGVVSDGGQRRGVEPHGERWSGGLEEGTRGEACEWAAPAALEA